LSVAPHSPDPEGEGNVWASADAAEAWRRGADRRNAALAAATERMLDLAELRPGMRVLDLAAGTGEQSLAAARRVEPDGVVLATDLSDSMLALAASTAQQAGLPVDTRVMDAGALEVEPASFDAAICRLGLMFVADVVAALAGVRRALKPGGRLAAVVWSAPERNPMMSMPRKVARELGLAPPPDQTLERALALGDPTNLDRAFNAAGFRDVVIEPMAARRPFASAVEAIQYARYESPAHRELSQHLSEANADRLWQAVQLAYARYETPTGCHIPGEVLLVAGTA
jgi:ubiquinone/menaquinone biosynthesis C-methylase UbiE